MRMRATILTGSLAAASLLLLATPAVAHEHRSHGDLEMVVGFAVEPAFAGQPNAASIQFVHDGHPVTDVKGMTVTITTGAQTSNPMELEPAFFIENGKVEFGTPGEYEASFVPTQPGTYTFHFVGTVDGEDVDEEFTSSPKTFSDVEDTNAASFPPVTAPSNEELATRIEQEAARTADAVKAAEASATSAGGDASGARTVGIIGIVVGALGLAVGIAALGSARSART